MDTATLTALNESIEHWNVLASTDNERARLGPESCALCARFNREDMLKDNCEGCPVMAATGKKYCRGTPYSNAFIASYRFGMGSSEFRAAALKMRDSLVSLLPVKT